MARKADFYTDNFAQPLHMSTRSDRLSMRTRSDSPWGGTPLWVKKKDENVEKTWFL